MTSADPKTLASEKLHAIQSLFTDLPSDLHDRAVTIARIRDAFHSQVAISMQDTLNQYITEQPQETFEDKDHVAVLVNSTLRSVGLTIECPKTGRPALLVVDTQDEKHPDVSRYRFKVWDERGRATRTLNTRNQLPELTLMPEQPRKEFWAKRRRDSGLSP